MSSVTLPKDRYLLKTAEFAKAIGTLIQMLSRLAEQLSAFAPLVSAIDDGKKLAMSRLGDVLRVAGTIELGGFDLSLDSPVAKARCHMLSRRIEEVLPGVCDTRTPEQGGNPQYWTGLRPATPTNIPFIGRTRVGKLWVNAGHGTLGWTHGAGSGKALAELISGAQPAMAFGFLGAEPGPHQRPVVAA